MKNLVLSTAIALTMLSKMVMAESIGSVDNYKISCQITNSPTFNLSIEVLDKIDYKRPYKYRESIFAVKVKTLSGPRLTGKEYLAVMTTSPIMTRVKVGDAYYVEVPDGTALSLENLSYDSSAYDKPDFKGSLINPNTYSITSLTCFFY